MQPWKNKNISIPPQKQVRLKGILPQSALVRRNIDGVTAPSQQVKPVPLERQVLAPQVSVQGRRFFSFRPFAYQRYVLPLVMLVALAAFAGGMSFALRTPKIAAQPVVLQKTKVKVGGVVTTLGPAQPEPSVSNDTLFNTPLEMLQSYFAPPAPDQLAQRTTALRAFLLKRKSPLSGEAATIAQQDHWKLILAISFAESTLGKHCENNNCSGIGGASQLRPYPSLKAWIVDFNRLLEKRYKDQTLEQMCGVYVQPCSTTWLLATKQLLTDLDGENIQ